MLAAEHDRSTFDDWKGKGNAAFSAQKFTTAVDWYNMIIANFEPHEELATVFSNASAAFVGMSRFAEALEQADRAVAAKPGWVKGHYRRGVALKNLSRLKEAREAFEKAVELDTTGSDELTSALRSVVRMISEGQSFSLLCPVCLDDPMLEPSLLVPCHHAVCAKCWFAQVERGIHRCPVCRNEFSGQTHVPLALLLSPLQEIIAAPLAESGRETVDVDQQRRFAAWYDLGLALMPTAPGDLPTVAVNGESVTGLECLQRAASCNPTNSDVWMKLGIFCRLSRRDAVVSGKPFTEKTSLLEALRVDKTNLIAWFKLGYFLFNEGVAAGSGDGGAAKANVNGSQVDALDCFEKAFQDPPFLLVSEGLAATAAMMIRMMSAKKGRCKVRFMRQPRTAIEIGQFVIENFEPESDELWDALGVVLDREHATCVVLGEVYTPQRAREKAFSLKSIQQNFNIYY